MIVGLSLPLCSAEPLWAADRPGAISGYVRDSSGTPQMGAVVEIIGVAARTLTLFTDDAGFYSAKDLLPGFYTVKVSAPSFLTVWRERVGLHPGASAHVDIRLSTLLNAMRVGPLRGSADDDDWKWTLRSVANRPVLRVFDDPASADKSDHELKATLSMVAGSESAGYGSGSDMNTGFSVERSVFSVDRIGLAGSVGYGDGAVPAGLLRATYSHMLPDGSGPSMAVAVRRLTPSDPNLHNASLQAMALSAADTMNVGDVVELKFGSEIQSVQFLGRTTEFRPHGSMHLHVSPNTVVGYSYTSSLPALRDEIALNPEAGDGSETDPRISVNNFSTMLERCRHQELNVSHRVGKTNMQAAIFTDHVENTALIGTGQVTAAGGYLLPDVYSGTFTYTGNTLNADGLRLVLERKLASDLTATLDYSYGGALDLARPGAQLQNAQQWIGNQRRQAIAAKLGGTVGRSHTSWIASYRWINGQALTPVDMFNDSPGQTGAFLNLSIRQPLPSLGFLPGHMDVLIDLRNLLAEGYVPVIGQDGQTVYLVQSARAVRGGVSISF